MSKRRSERRSAPRPGSATHGYRNPDPKQQRRRRRRHCSRVRRPRFPYLALRPHPSRHGSESASPQPAPCQKDVRKGVRHRDRGQRPQLQKIRIRNRGAGGKAATVAGYAGPGFHTWPSATSLKTRLRIRFSAAGPMPKKRSARRSAPRPGSATHGDKRSGSKTTAQAAKPPL